MLENPFTEINKPFHFKKQFESNVLKIDIDMKYDYNKQKSEKEQLVHTYTHSHIRDIVNVTSMN